MAQSFMGTSDSNPESYTSSKVKAIGRFQQSVSPAAISCRAGTIDHIMTDAFRPNVAAVPLDDAVDDRAAGLLLDQFDRRTENDLAASVDGGDIDDLQVR